MHSSIRQEVARSFGAILIALTTVVMTMTLIRTLGQAARGSLNPSDVMLIMGYSVLAYMPTVLVMSLFIAIVAGLTRMYRDSEMVIWFGGGRGMAALLPPLLRFAWPVLLLILVLALLILPWTNARIAEMRDQYEKRGDIERIEPGQFQESAGGQRVFFVEKNVGPNQQGNNVFIATQEKGKETMTSARQGRVQVQNNQRFLWLSNGQRLERDTNTADIKISEFAEYSVRVGADVLPDQAPHAVNTRSTLELLSQRSAVNVAELWWRLGLALAAFNLVVLGVAISAVNPRAGRGFNLGFGLFAFMIYFNLLSLGQAWIAAQQVSAWAFVLALHGGALLLGSVWLAKGHYNWRWRELLRPPGGLARKAIP